MTSGLFFGEPVWDEIYHGCVDVHDMEHPNGCATGKASPEDTAPPWAALNFSFLELSIILLGFTMPSYDRSPPTKDVAKYSQKGRMIRACDRPRFLGRVIGIGGGLFLGAISRLCASFQEVGASRAAPCVPKIGIEAENRQRFPTAEGHTPFPIQRMGPISTRTLQAENSLLCPSEAQACYFAGELETLWWS